MSTGDSRLRARFQPGDHLRVRRRWLYFHHGIYISDTRIVQFGGRVGDKQRARIEAVTLSQFEDGRPAELVDYAKDKPLGFWVPEGGPPEDIVARAEWLIRNHPSGRYNLFGHNCENIANWCVNRFCESSQVRWVFFARAVAGIPIALLYRRLSKGGVTAQWVGRALIAFELSGLLLAYMRFRRSRWFYRNIDEKWLKEAGGPQVEPQEAKHLPGEQLLHGPPQESFCGLPWTGCGPEQFDRGF